MKKRIHYLHSRSLNSEEANIIQVVQMCQAFSKLGHEVVLSLPDNGKDPAVLLKERFDIEGTTFDLRSYSRIGIGGRFKSLGCIPAAVKEIRSVSSDVLFLRDAIILPWVVSKHERILFEIHNTRIGPAWISDRLVTPRLVHLSNRPQLKAFITISEALKRWWAERGVPAGKLIALHDGVDLERFAVSLDQNKARKKLGLPLDKKIVVYTGSLYRDRGIERIFRLARNVPMATFIVVGGPESRREELEVMTQKGGLSNIRFTGYRPQNEIPFYLASADVLLALWSKTVPTMNYCSPLKLFEYLASGRIIVSDGFPTIREVMRDGVHGYLVNPESYEEMQSALIKALSVSSNGMGLRARELAHRYSWESRCNSILEFNTRCA